MSDSGRPVLQSSVSTVSTTSSTGSGHSSRNSSVKITPGALVCDAADLRGEITIGSRTVIHPKARIIAEAGPIFIGEANLIEEHAEIINRLPPDEAENTNRNQTVMIIGNNNVFEVGCRSEALQIGDFNVLETKARLGRNTELTNGCIIGAMCEVNSSEILVENTVVYGEGCERRVQTERPPAQTLQLDFLTKILPNYHHIRKASKLSASQK